MKTLLHRGLKLCTSYTPKYIEYGAVALLSAANVAQGTTHTHVTDSH